MVIKKQNLIDIYFIVSLILFTGAILTLGGELWGTASPEGDPIQRSIYLIIYIFMLPLLIVKFRYIHKLIISEKIIGIIIIISILSILWSELPLITFRRVVALTLTTLFGIVFAYNYKLDDQINILAYSFGIIVIICFLTSMFFPEIGIHQFGLHEGRWRGVFVQKNTMASILVLAVLVFVYKLRNTKKNRIVNLLMLGLSLFLIFMAWSATSLVSLFIIYLSIYIFIFYTKLTKKNVIINISAIFLIMFIISFYVYTNIEDIFIYFGKDMSLTGRLPFWVILFDSIQNKPLLGYGYGAFWHGNESPSANVLRKLTWIPNDAHNGYIDILLSVGIVGLILIIIKIIDIFTSTKKLYNKNKNKKNLLIISVVVYIIILNITSTSILVQNSIFWVLLVSISIGIRKEYIKPH